MILLDTHIWLWLLHDPNIGWVTLRSTQPRAHHQFEKQPSTFDPSEHEEMLIQRALQLQNEGFTVYVENQNS